MKSYWNSSSNTLELPCTGGSLLISPDSRGWSRVVLHHQSRDVVLGSEAFEYIIDHLMAFLVQDNFAKLSWVLSLAELHHSFYGERNEEEATLKIQDRNAKWIAELKLTGKQQIDWKSSLSFL